MFIDLFENRKKGSIVNIFLEPIRLGIYNRAGIIEHIKNDFSRRRRYGNLPEHLQILEWNFDHPNLDEFIDYYIWYSKLSDEDRRKQKKHKNNMNAKKRNLKNHINRHRPLSWSALSAFEYNKEQFYSKYIEGIKTDPTPKMLYGNVVGERIASDANFLPEISPRYKIYEKKLEGKIGEICLTGFLDNYCPDTHAFHEFKTSSSKTRWTQKSANEHGQILFYKLLIWLNYQIPPEQVKCRLWYIPVHENGSFEMELSKELIQSFEVKHTSADVLKFGNYIKQVWKEMEEFVESYSSER